MKILGLNFSKKPLFERANSKSLGELRFVSTAAMERGLDGSDESFESYFFSIYHCSPSEKAGINERRELLKLQFPEKVIPVGKYFTLCGQPAYLALAAYYQALIICETLSEEYRNYAEQRLNEITESHKKSQSLPIPIDLTEGQLSQDFKLEFLTCIAIANGQIYSKSDLE